MSEKTALIVGASSGVGRALATEFAKAGCDLLLVARDAKDLEVVARDCEIRYIVKAQWKTLDLGDSNFTTEAIEAWVAESGGYLKYVCLPAGANSGKDSGAPPDETLINMTNVNYLSLAKIMTMAANHADRWALRTILVCSSIAASAPRKRNMAYASAKSALTTFSLGLRHLLSTGPAIVQVYSLGYVDSGLSFGQKLLFPVISPQVVAREMVRDINKDVGVRFFPFYWRYIVAALRLLPWAVYKRLSF